MNNNLSIAVSVLLPYFVLILYSASGQNSIPATNLIQNPDCELPLVNKQIPYWTNVLGARWGIRSRDPLPQSGKNYFFAWAVPEAELAQTVSLANYADLIARNSIRFRFSGYVRSWPQRPSDASQIIIEMLDDNDTVLTSYDLGVYDQYNEWKLLTKVLVPAQQTTKIKIRLLSHRKNGSNNDGYFDNLSLMPEITPSKPQIQQEATILRSTVSGQVFDKQTLRPVNATLSITGDKLSPQTVISNNEGVYTFKAPVKDVCIVSITKEGYQLLRETVTVDRPSQIKNFFLVPNSVSPEPPVYNQPMVLKNVLFKLSTATLLPQSFAELDKLASLMQTKPALKVRLEGHTDRIGDAASNLALSQDRVAEVKRYLIQRGVSDTRITIKGYGDTKNICTTPCEANRRVEFILTE